MNIPGSIEYGLGDLSGTFGIREPTATTTIAYLVLKESDIPNLQMFLKASRLGFTYPTLAANQIVFVNDLPSGPEPSALTLLCVATMCSIGASRWRSFAWPRTE